jgi:hypothetical protein
LKIIEKWLRLQSLTVTDVAVFDYSQPVFCVKDVENNTIPLKTKKSGGVEEINTTPDFGLNGQNLNEHAKFYRFSYYYVIGTLLFLGRKSA